MPVMDLYPYREIVFRNDVELNVMSPGKICEVRPIYMPLPDGELGTQMQLPNSLAVFTAFHALNRVSFPQVDYSTLNAKSEL